MNRSPGLFFSLARVLSVSSFYPSVFSFRYVNASDWPKRIVSMEVVNSSLEGIDRIMSLVNSTDYTNLDSESDHDSNMHAVDESAGERMVVNGEELHDTNAPNCSNVPEVEEFIDTTNETDHRFRVQFHLPKALRRFLTKQEIHLKLMREMHTTIKIPHNKKKSGNVVVTGCNETNVIATYQKIRELFSDGRRELGPTHFVSIPMNTPSIRERYEVFKNQVLENYVNESNNIEDTLFSSARKLHLTLCVLTLASETEHNTACRKLNECQKSVIEPLLKNRALMVRMRGIDIMNSDPTKTRVLYAKVESRDDILQKLADDVEAFYMNHPSSSTMKGQNIRVKLHVTLMNAKFLRRKNRRSNKFKSRFNATDILKNFKEFDFGEISVNSMHLSQMCSLSKDDYYVSSNIIQWS